MMYLRYDEHVRALHRAAMPSYKALNLSGDTRNPNRRAENAQKDEGRRSHRASNDPSPLNTLPMAKLGGFSSCAPTADASKSPATAPSAATDASATTFDGTCIEDGCNQPHNGSWTDRCNEHAAEYFAFDFDGIDL